MNPVASFKHVLAFLHLLQDRFRHVRAQQAAASLAFTSLLSLVPLIAVSVGVMSKFKTFDYFGGALKGFLLDNLLPDKAGTVIAKYTLQFSEQANKLTAVGSGMLFVAALVMLLTIDRAFNQIWQVSRARPFVFRLLTYWTALTLGPLVLGSAVVGVGRLVNFPTGEIFETSGLSHGVPVFLLTAFLTFLYCVVPNRRVHLIHALAGGLLASASILLMQRLFGTYLAHFGNYTLIYGAFAVVPVFLLWLYVCWVMVLLGALVAALLPEYQSGYRVVHRFAGRRYYAALMILAELARAREEGKARPLSVLTRCSRIGVAETEKVLNQLRAAHWVERSEKQRWLLSCDLEKVPLQAVFSHFALDLNDWPSPQSDEEDRLIHRLKQAHGCAPRGLEVSLSALLDPASPTTQSGG